MGTADAALYCGVAAGVRRNGPKLTLPNVAATAKLQSSIKQHTQALGDAHATSQASLVAQHDMLQTQFDTLQGWVAAIAAVMLGEKQKEDLPYIGEPPLQHLLNAMQINGRRAWIRVQVSIWGFYDDHCLDIPCSGGSLLPSADETTSLNRDVTGSGLGLVIWGCILAGDCRFAWHLSWPKGESS